jgi:proteasome lid subunit RPN8/RPN11
MTNDPPKQTDDKQPPMAATPDISIHADVPQRIRRHGRSSLNAEVGGILLGKISGTTTVIDALIPADKAAHGGAHVTFTQDAWEEIYKIKDAQYPDSRIVGWYHTHPGFGVFLSEYDLFIHRNFFSDPQQVAWVYDPISDEEGCFIWSNTDITRQHALRILPPSQTLASPGSSRTSKPDIATALEGQPRLAHSPTTLASFLASPTGLLIATAAGAVLVLLVYIAAISTLSYRHLNTHPQRGPSLIERPARQSIPQEKPKRPDLPPIQVTNDSVMETVTNIGRQIDTLSPPNMESPSHNSGKDIPQ